MRVRIRRLPRSCSPGTCGPTPRHRTLVLVDSRFDRTYTLQSRRTHARVVPVPCPLRPGARSPTAVKEDLLAESPRPLPSRSGPWGSLGSLRPELRAVQQAEALRAARRAARPDPIAALGWALSRHDDGDVLIVDEPAVMRYCRSSRQSHSASAPTTKPAITLIHIGKTTPPMLTSTWKMSRSTWSAAMAHKKSVIRSAAGFILEPAIG